MPVKSMATPLVEATAVPLLIKLLGAATVVVPSAFRTMLFEPELVFLRLVVESVLIGSLVKDVDRPGVEGPRITSKADYVKSAVKGNWAASN